MCYLKIKTKTSLFFFLTKIKTFCFLILKSKDKNNLVMITHILKICKVNKSIRLLYF